MKKEDKKIINWRKPQFTFIEFLLGILGFSFIGLGAGSWSGSITGEAMMFLVWVGWGISMIPPVLLIIRLGVFKKKDKTDENHLS